MTRRERKKAILASLDGNDCFTAIRGIGGLSPHELIAALFSALCATSETVRWNGIRMFGLVVPNVADAEMEKGRVIMRRFLWSLNDESGGIGWGAPEAMGEIMARHDGLYREYHHMLLSYMRTEGPELHADGNYLELPGLQRGVLWGIGRLLETRREALLAEGIEADLRPYLQSSDGVVRGLAIRCLTVCRDRLAENHIRQLVDDEYVLRYLEGDTIRQVTVSRLAEEYLERLQMP